LLNEIIFVYDFLFIVLIFHPPWHIFIRGALFTFKTCWLSQTSYRTSTIFFILTTKHDHYAPQIDICHKVQICSPTGCYSYAFATPIILCSCSSFVLARGWARTSFVLAHPLFLLKDEQEHPLFLLEDEQEHPLFLLVLCSCSIFLLSV